MREAGLLLSSAAAASHAAPRLLSWQESSLALHLAASTGNVEPVQLLLAAAPKAAQFPDSGGRLPLHLACQAGHKAVVELLMAAAPTVLLLTDSDGRTPVDLAVAHRRLEVLQVLLQHDTELMHRAAEAGNVAALTLMLAAAPEAASARNNYLGWTPLHIAADCNTVGAIQLLLAAAPGTAILPDIAGQLPIHWAAKQGHAVAVQLMAAAAPDTVQATDRRGYTPLLYAAWQGHTAVVAALLAASPAAAFKVGPYGGLPVHTAAEHGHVETLQLLLDAAPDTATTKNSLGHTPIEIALMQRHVSAACCLLRFGPAPEVLELLRCRLPHSLPLYVDFVIARAPLTDDEWALVPAPCPRLGRALPTALARSPAQARWLVAHLPAPDAQLLRTAALCLARAQRSLGLPLPTPLVQQVLCLAMSADP